MERIGRESSTASARSRRSDRGFFLAYAIIGFVGVAFGFTPPSLKRFAGHADYPAPIVLQVHAGLFLAWVALILAQVLLVRRGDLALHRRLGQVAYGMVPAMALFSLFAEAWSERFYMVREPGSERFFAVPLFSLLLFPALTLLGLLWRQRPEVHKRCIYLGTSVLFGAAWSRVMGHFILPHAAHETVGRLYLQYFLVGNLFVVALAAYDLARLRRLHPATLWGGLAIFGLTGLICATYYTAGWLAVVDGILTVFPGP